MEHLFFNLIFSCPTFSTESMVSWPQKDGGQILEWGDLLNWDLNGRLVHTEEDYRKAIKWGESIMSKKINK